MKKLLIVVLALGLLLIGTQAFATNNGIKDVFTKYFYDDGSNDDNEVEISVNSLPQVIQNAITADYPSSVLLEADEITQADGTLTYDVELRYNNEIIELVYKEDGTFLGVEVDDNDDDDGEDEDDENEIEISVTSLPQVVQNNIETSYPNSVLLEADEVTQADGTLTYDVELRYNGEIIEVMYSADGNFLGVEVDDDDDDDEDDD